MKLFCFIVLVLAILPAMTWGQSWNSAQTTGLTNVQATLNANMWEFVLSNLSDTDFIPIWNVLVWSLQPFNVPQPTSVTAPTGWSWNGNGWQQFSVDLNQKWYTPPALAPGESYPFTLTFLPGAPIINYEASINGQLGFISHVGQVVPGSGSKTGAYPWTASSCGNTWFDKSTNETTAIPEFPTLALGIMGLLTVGTSRWRQR